MCTINHDKKMIFINIPKTGRTFISENLVKYYGFTEYLLRRPDHRAYCNSLQNYTFFNKTKGIIDYYKTSPELCNIMSMDENKWNSYYKFCFFRKPFDRVRSAYEYITSTQNLQQLQESNPNKIIKILEINDFISNYNATDDYTFMHAFMPQYAHIIDENNEIFVNYIGNFDTLNQDFCEILINKGFDVIHENVPMNESKREKYDLTQQSTDIINSLYVKDIDFIKNEKKSC